VFKNKKMAGHMGARNRTQQNLEVVRTDPVRGLLFIKGSVPGTKGGWVAVEDAVKLPRHDGVPYPAGLVSKNQPVEEAAPAGLVDDAAVHEIPALPGDDEVAAIAAEQEAGAAAEAQAEDAAEADAADAAQSADNQKADAAEGDKSAPAGDDGKEG
jgi:large subunit ribosomal protein L3